MAALRALVRLFGITREQPDDQPLDGTCDEVTLVAAQTGVALQLIATDQLVAGSTYLWEAIRVPLGRKVYMEATGLGANLGSVIGITVSLYTAAGALVPNSMVVISSITEKRMRLTTPLALADNTEYVVKYKTSGLAGTAYLYSVRLVIR